MSHPFPSFQPTLFTKSKLVLCYLKAQLMHVISKKPFLDAATQYPNARNALLNVYRTLEKSDFATPESMRNVFPSLDNFKNRDKWWVFDIAGNHLRMIAAIEFQYQKVFVKHIVTHAEYDKLCRNYAKDRQ
ncbi:MAG: type II toxin-antitoxin system HigB family toxin [Thiomicrospira sp.]|jgi:mRNA interferase HigB|nr:type II toxin-antitoxin system HigB family toxin [Thiomicrospira sp.]